VKRLTLICLLVNFLCLNAYGQEETKSILYEHEWNAGLLLHTRGMGVSLQFTKERTASNYRLWDFNVYNLRDPKEIRLPNPYIQGSRDYCWNKANALIAIKANYGTRKIIADRFLKQNVKVNFNYTFGPIMGILKPVYYDVKLDQPDGSDPKVISVKWDPENINYQQNTIGYSPATKGLFESQLIFGANAKGSFSFEWGKYDYKFYNLETGVMVDAFPQEVPIFATGNNNRVFVNIFLCLTYGTRH
jgi:hypothetical protein